MSIINIREELKLSHNLDDVINNLESEQENINKKLYIFKILRFIDSLNQLNNVNDFKNLNVNSGTLAYGYDREENEYFIVLRFIDSDGKQIGYNLDKNIRNACKFPGRLDVTYLSEDFQIDKLYYLNFSMDIKKDLLDLFLSKELKSVLEYNEIDNELDNKKEIVLKKPKL